VSLAYGNDLNSLTFVGLGTCFSTCWLVSDELITVGISDPIRFGVKEAIRRTKESGVKVVIITGDAKETGIECLHSNVTLS
jgi:P-type E1-E2 ATPase